MPATGQTDVFLLKEKAPQIALLFGRNLYSTTSQYMPTYASTITLDIAGASEFFITTNATVGNATITAAVGGIGHQIEILIAGDASAGRTITFGTNFLSTGTLTTVQSKTVVIDFTSNGTAWIETGRQSTGA